MTEPQHHHTIDEVIDCTNIASAMAVSLPGILKPDPTRPEPHISVHAMVLGDLARIAKEQDERIAALEAIIAHLSGETDNARGFGATYRLGKPEPAFTEPDDDTVVGPIGTVKYGRPTVVPDVVPTEHADPYATE